MAPDHKRPTSRELVGALEIGSGGMCSVYLAKQRGERGFSRVVAVKRLHPRYAKDTEFVAMLVDEARFVSRIHHPNVVSILDVVEADGQLELVMEYIRGAPLGELIRKGAMPPRIALGITVQVLAALQAAHDARDERGELLGLIHRDVSPQNVLVGEDGIAKLVDFGIAKASAGRVQVTRTGLVKGKFSYMAPEQLEQKALTQQVDIYATSVVLWECLTGQGLFAGELSEVMAQVLAARVVAPSASGAHVDAELDAVVLRGLARDPKARFSSARAMSEALVGSGEVATAAEIGAWVARVADAELHKHDEWIARLERASDGALPVPRRTDVVTEVLPAPGTEAPPAAVALAVPRARSKSLVGWAIAACIVTAAVYHRASHGATVYRDAARIVERAPPPLPQATALPQERLAERPVEAPPVIKSPSRPQVASAHEAASHDAAKPDCHPPYIIDAQGYRRYKPACL